jgi:hypothetical protein
LFIFHGSAVASSIQWGRLPSPTTRDRRGAIELRIYGAAATKRTARGRAIVGPSSWIGSIVTSRPTQPEGGAMVTG